MAMQHFINQFCPALPVQFKYRARIVLIAGCCLALLTPALALSASKNWQEGERALEKGDYAAALKEFLPLAKKGNSIAQFNLGFMYHEGKGVPRDAKEAVKWYRLAADQGDPAAQFSLGVIYASGDGVPRDYKEAARWYRLAANQGTPGAQLNLGFMYGRGNGVAQNYV